MQQDNRLELVECPRDAMQGWPHLISTENKTLYLQALLEVGFHTLDFGSFVNPKAIPQMADTGQVLEGLETAGHATKLLAIVANLRGAEQACLSGKISYIGFPFSISETFQQRNTHADINTAFQRVKDIQQLCTRMGKELVVYLSMGFGNPYGDPFSEELVLEWTSNISGLGVRILSLADTVGLATPEQVHRISRAVIAQHKNGITGVHLHARPDGWKDKIDAAWDAGVRRFDAAIMGFGGCPMAGDELVGNIPMELLVAYLESKGIHTGLDMEALFHATQLAKNIFL